MSLICDRKDFLMEQKSCFETIASIYRAAESRQCNISRSQLLSLTTAAACERASPAEPFCERLIHNGAALMNVVLGVDVSHVIISSLWGPLQSLITDGISC